MITVVPSTNKDYKDYMVKAYSLQVKMYMDMKDWAKVSESAKENL